jgi:hypothetical protein
MAEPVRHRQTKGAATDMFDLQPPRHISTLRNPAPRCVKANVRNSPIVLKTLQSNRDEILIR